LLLQPSQLPFERFELLHIPADQDQQLRDHPFGGQSSFFPLPLALDSSGMLGPIIMRGLSITPLPRQGFRVARLGYILVETDHRTDRSRGGAACPAQNARIGGLADFSPAKNHGLLWKSLNRR
jgi:hypothetical protein